MNTPLHFLKLIIFVSTIVVVGRALLSLISLNKTMPVKSIPNLPASFLLGSTAITLTALPLSIAGIATSLWTFWLTAGVIMAIALWRIRQTPHATDGMHERNACAWSWLEISFFALLAALLVCNYLFAITQPDYDIDMVAHILMKSKILTDSTYRDAIYLRDPVFALVHGNYPPLPVFLYSFMFLFGLEGTGDFQAINYFILFMLGLTLHSTLRKHIPVWQSLLWTFIFLSTREFIRNQYIMSSNDILLSLALLTITLIFLNTDKKDSPLQTPLFAILAVAALLIKSDALPFIAILLTAMSVQARRFPTRTILIILAVTGPWLIFRTMLPDPGEGGEHAIKNITNMLSLTNLPLALKACWQAVSSGWHGFFLIGALSWPFLLHQGRVGTIALTTAAVFVIYTIVIWIMIPQAPSYVPGFLRLISHIYPIVFLLTVLSLYPTQEKLHTNRSPHL